jgi:hypothetical protein
MHYVEPITVRDLVKDKGARMLGQLARADSVADGSGAR